ncbi:MAG TPA: TolC family protein [Phycisphaerae bacterium]|nr:TolC family protein [Phycisphaerae bacterium]
MAAVSGCTVGPDYTTPDFQTPDYAGALEEKSGTTGAITPEILASWWDTLGDPILTDLIEKAAQSNLDLKVARARVRQSRAQLGIAESALLPQFDASGLYSRARDSKSSAFMPESTTDFNVYRAGLDAGWEIDIFGGTRRAVEAAKAELESQDESLKSVLVSLASEVALDYIELRTVQERMNVANGNLKIQKQTLDLLESRFNSGLCDELAIQQARYNLETTRSMIPRLISAEEAVINALEVLLGSMPGELHKMLQAGKPIPVPSFQNVTGIPANALRQRPDVRIAERQLAAQTARIGQATADLYPKFSLVGSIGLESLNSGDFMKADSGFYSIGPSMTWPIFHGGAIRQNIKAQTALQEQYLARYEKVVLSAVKEVRDALVAYAQEQLSCKSLRKAVKASQEAVDISMDKYKNGLVDFNNVLVAQRSMLTLQESLAISEGEIAGNLVRVYKALGGGWQPMAAEYPPANKQTK